jgi:mRNA-degrading endonuclease RelE of RelBE toxin-antitoxin system
VSYAVRYTDRAAAELRRLARGNPARARRIDQALARFAEHCQGDVVRLQHVEPPEWRFRVGDWRVGFQLNHGARTLYVLRILPSGRAYRD